MMTGRCGPQKERQQTTLRAHQGGKQNINCGNGLSVQLPFTSRAVRLSDGNLSFETGLFQDAKMQGVSVLTVMDQPKQPANLKGELFFKLN